jgi:thiazole synthase ThiGH ThiG subunit
VTSSPCYPSADLTVDDATSSRLIVGGSEFLRPIDSHVAVTQAGEALTWMSCRRAAAFDQKNTL